MASKSHLTDYYHDLGLERSASSRDIKVAYMKLAIKHHPDKNTGDRRFDASEFRKVSWCLEYRLDPFTSTHQLTDLLSQIQTAYETLRDPEKRAKYDKRTSAASTIASRRAKHAQKKASQPSDPSTQHGQTTRPSAAASTNHSQRATPSTSAPKHDWAPPRESSHPFFTTGFGWSSYHGDRHHTNEPSGPHGAQSRWSRSRPTPFSYDYETGSSASPPWGSSPGMREQQQQQREHRERAAAVDEEIGGRATGGGEAWMGQEAFARARSRQREALRAAKRHQRRARLEAAARERATRETEGLERAARAGEALERQQQEALRQLEEVLRRSFEQRAADMAAWREAVRHM